MKRLFAAAVALLLALGASAQGFIIKGGVNVPNQTAVSDITSFNSWFAGIGVQSFSRAGFSIQPELLYRVNGVTLEDAKSYKLNTIELPVNIQWGIDLLVAKPFIFVTPFAGYNLINAEGAGDDLVLNMLEKVCRSLEYGAGIGAGINIWKLQLTGRYNWTFGQIDDWSTISKDLKGINMYNASSLEFALGIKF